MITEPVVLNLWEILLLPLIKSNNVCVVLFGCSSKVDDLIFFAPIGRKNIMHTERKRKERHKIIKKHRLRRVAFILVFMTPCLSQFCEISECI